MTVSTAVFFTDWFLANGVNKDWPYDFVIYQSADVRVQVRTGTDDETIVEYSAGFSFNPAGDFEAGVITYPASGAALAAPLQIRIVRDVAYTQTTEIGQEGDFQPIIHERAFDKLTMLAQQLNNGYERSFKVPLGNPDPGTLYPQDGMLLGWNGTTLANFDPTELTQIGATPEFILAQLESILDTLPTSPPVEPNKLWNNFGVLCISL